MHETEVNVNPVTADHWIRFVDKVASELGDHDPRRLNRREPFENYEDVKLFIQDAGDVRHCLARITEVSVGGVSLWTDCEVPVCTRVMFEFHPDNKPVKVKGRIVHCTQTVGGYKVGIEIEFPK